MRDPRTHRPNTGIPSTGAAPRVCAGGGDPERVAIAPDRRSADDEAASAERGARKLARHTLLTVMQMAEEEKLSADAVVGMFVSMADTHRRAAKIIERMALKVKLNVPGAAR